MKKKFTVILLALLMTLSLLPGSAFAEGADYAVLSAENITVDIPDVLSGIVTAEVSDGRVVFTINKAAADKWAEVYNGSWAMDGFSRMIDAGFFVEAKDYKYFQVRMDHELTDSEKASFTAGGSEDCGGAGKSAYTSVAIANFLQTDDGYEMIPQYEDYFYYIYWCDENGNMVDDGIYHMEIDVRLAPGVGDVFIGRDIVPALTNVPANRVMLQQADEVNVIAAANYDASTGIASYSLTGVSQGNQIYTGVKAPGENYTACTATYLNNIWQNSLEVDINETNDAIFLPTSLESTVTDKWKLSWTDENGVVALEELITVYTSMQSGEGWMDIYWDPIDADHLSGSNAPAGLAVSVENGEISCTYSANEIPSLADFENATISIAPPSGDFAYYKISMFSAGNIGFNYNKQYADACAADMADLTMQGDGTALIRALCPMTKLEVNGITLMYAPAFKGVVLIDWYKNETDTIPEKRQYYTYKNDEIIYRVKSESVESEDQITGVVNKPVMVHEGSWELICTAYPQGGKENAQHIFLKERHYDGDKLVSGELNGETVIYIPFPKGIAEKEGENYQYTLIHYLDDNHTRYENITATPTPHGLRFVVSSLSPFVLEWTEIDDGSNNNNNNGGGHGGHGNHGGHSGNSENTVFIVAPPKTGDNSMYTTASAACAVMLAIVYIGRKRKA